MLVPERLLRLSTTFADPVGQLHHLINRLLPIQTHDVIICQFLAIFMALSRQSWKDFREHWNHDLRPSLTDDRQGSIEVKKDVRNLWPWLK